MLALSCTSVFRAPRNLGVVATQPSYMLQHAIYAIPSYDNTPATSLPIISTSGMI